MGCDIHIRLEKIDNDGEWKSIDLYKIREDWEDSKDYYPKTFPFVPVDIYDGRDYELFGVLAGVRSCEIPIVPPRGLPDSTNKYTRSEFEACKSWAHTPSYLTLGELRKTWYAHANDKPTDEDGYENVYTRLLHNIIEPIENRLCSLHYVWGDTDVEITEECRKYWDSVRIVFWFDN